MPAIQRFDTIHTVRLGPLEAMWWRRPLRGFWFRVFGYGLAVDDHRESRPLFSERYSGQFGIPLGVYLHVGPRCIHALGRRR